MRNKSVLFNIYFLSLALLMVSACILRSVALLRDLDYVSGHFSNKLIIGIADKLIIGATLFAISYVFFAKRDRALIFDFSSPLNYVFSGTLGAALLLYSGYALSHGSKTRSYLLILTGILAILSTVHFFLASITTVISSERRADFGIITVIFLALYSAFLYFDSTLPINSPTKIVDEMTYVVAALFFLYETRISIGREKWPRYTTFGFITMLLSAYSAIPALISYIISGNVTANNIFETILTFAIFLFTTARLTLTASLQEKKECPAVSFIKAAAIKRCIELAPKSEEPEVIEATEKDEEAGEHPEDYYELNFDEETANAASDETETETEA